MTRVSLSPLDIGLLAAYFGATLLVGFWRRQRGTEDYLIANRSLSLPVFVATLVATWYGGILAVGENTYAYGLANWTTLGLPYYVFAVVFALALAGRIRSAALYTIPDKLAAEYGRGPALVGAAFTFLMATPAPYVLMMGQMITLLTGWPMLPAMLAGVVFSVAYVYAGGFESDVRINVFQFLLMFGGFALALAIVTARLGGFEFLRANLPPAHLQLSGGQDAGYILVWFFIALWTLVDPGFHQRCYAARSPRVARNGILAAVGCWFVFDFLTTSLGLYARAALPDLAAGEQPYAFPLLAERTLPPGVKALFWAGMLATVMSTVVSYTFLGAMAVGRDLIWRVRGEEGTERVPRYTRIGLVLTTLVALGVCLLVPHGVKQWWAIGTVFVPGLLIPVAAAYFPRWKVSGGYALAMMLLGSGVSLACLTIGWSRHGVLADTSQFPFGMQPLYPGLAVATVIFGLGITARRLRRPPIR